MTTELGRDYIALREVFSLAFSWFSQPFEVYGYTVSWFGIAVACFVIAIPFIILERVLDL